MIDLPVFWVAVLVVVAILLFRRLRRRTPGKGAGRGSDGIDVEADLVHACRGDQALAERLIAHELERNDSLSRTGAALMALAKLRDDQR